MLPQGMFSVALATVLFPALSRFAARGDFAGLRDAARPAACARSCLLLVPGRRGDAGAGDADHAARSTSTARSAPTRPTWSPSALFWFSFSLPFSGLNLLLTRTFFTCSSRGSPPASLR